MPQICTTPNCLCSENPFANLSSEGPDRQIFIGLNWNFQQPALGHEDWTRVECGITCQSSVSQYDADQCALRMATRCVLCDHHDPPCPNPVVCNPCVDPGIEPCPPPFGNVMQGCQNAQYSAQVDACEYYASTQADADAIAASVCQWRLNNGPRTPKVLGCPSILAMFPTSPVHVFVGETVVISAAIQYTGTGTMEFMWFKDQIPLLITATPILTLSNVSILDSATYTLHVIVSGCPPSFSPPVILNVVCTPDVGIPAPKFDIVTGEYDYVSQVSKGIFDIPFGFDYGVCGTVLRIYIDCGVFPEGWYQVNINSGIGWHLTGQIAGLPFDEPYSMGIGVEFEVGGFPTDVADYSVEGCFGYAFLIPCPNPEAYTLDFFGAASYPVVLVGFTEHSGGNIRFWGPTLYTGADPGTLAGSICGTQTRFELIQHVMETQPQYLAIEDFSLLKSQITNCDTCQDRNGVEWDGSLERITYNPYYINYAIPGTFDSNTVSLNSKRISRSSCSIILSELNDGTPVWILEIKCKRIGQPSFGTSGDIVWRGFKSSGRTPEGTYMHTDTYLPWSGQTCSKTPNCLKVVAI